MTSTSKEKSCYCCVASNSSNAKSRCNSGGTESDVDVIRLNNALHELGMLSTVTESRRQYLREKKAANARRQRESEETTTGNQNYRSKKGFCVINMNYDYITDFSGKCGASSGDETTSSSSSASPQRKFRSCGCDSDVLDNHNLFSMLPIQQDQQHCGASRVRYRSNRNRLRFQKPYEIPWLPSRCETKAWNSRISSELDSSASSSPLSKDSCCNLNRSNPGSPEKVVVELVSTNLIRSRSLDDMEAINLTCGGADAAAAVKISMPCCQKVEIESMSQRMEDLHVN